jgi:ATP-dependent Clp protease ATP-binding subunit ClpC
VQYAEDALTIAVTYSSRHVKNRSLPDKAIDLLDDAGAYVKMEQEAAVLPADVIENRKRISFVQQRLENAIANHEFEKARFYGDEERKEKAALQELEKKYNIRTDLVGTVTAAHVEEALARWTGMSLASIRESPAGAGANIEKQSAEQPNGGKKRKKKSS